MIARVMIVAAMLLASGAAVAAEGRIVAAQAADVPTLDPTVDTASIGINVRINIFDQLTEVAPDGSVTPKLATGWEPSARAVFGEIGVGSGAPAGARRRNLLESPTFRALLGGQDDDADGEPGVTAQAAA